MPAVVIRMVRNAEAGPHALPHTEWLKAHDLTAPEIFSAVCALAAKETVTPLAPGAGVRVEWVRYSLEALVFLQPAQAEAVAALLAQPGDIFKPHAAIREKAKPKPELVRVPSAPPKRRAKRCRRAHSRSDAGQASDWRAHAKNCGGNDL